MTKRLLLLYLAALGFLSLNPWFKPSGEAAFGGVAWDKFDHAIAYGGLTVLLLLSFTRTPRGAAPALWAILAASGLGILTEFCQAWFTDSRMFSYLDASANSVGAVLGAAALWSFRSLSSRFRHSPA